MSENSSLKGGKYRLHERIGGGGMGEVYRAELVGPGGFVRSLAVKVIRAELCANARFLEMFLREGRALASLSHRSIVQVFELDVDEGRAFLAMEWLRGFDLRQVMQRVNGPCPWPVAAHIAAEVARALDAAHALKTPEAPEGLVHGDLSPSNVMLCLDGAVKVLDFGLAKPVGTEQSSSGAGGKLAYLPPEALAGLPPDHRTDLYALGAVLYELLTGKTAFQGANELQTVQRILDGHATPPSQQGVELPTALDALVLSCLARDRGARPKNGEALATSLESLVQGQFSTSDLTRWLKDLHPEVVSAPTATPKVELPAGGLTEVDGPVSLAKARKPRWKVAAVTALVVGTAAVALGALTLGHSSKRTLPIEVVPVRVGTEAEVPHPSPTRSEWTLQAMDLRSPAAPSSPTDTPSVRRAVRRKVQRHKVREVASGLAPGFLADPDEGH